MYEYLRRNAKSKDNFPLGRMIEEQEKEVYQSKPWPLRERWGKTNWDWLQLLIVPLLILFLTVAFTWYQNVRLNQREDERVQQAQKIENQRAEAARELVVQRAQDEALQAYLNQMTDLLLEKNLRESKQDSELRILAQARTATVVQTLDVDGNRSLIRFLDEAKLTGDLYGENPSAISLLSETDLTGARLQGLDLQNVDLHGTILDDADLRGTSPVWLVEASLIGADMRRIYLEDANLNYAIMEKADLRDAVLLNANFIGASLKDADLILLR